MTEIKETRAVRSRLGSVGRSLAWVGVGILLTAFLLVDPLHMHSFDRWLHGVLGLESHAGDVDHGRDGGQSADGERKILFYRNPMNPTITSPVPMKDEMGMDYVPVYADAASPLQDRKVLFYRNPMDPTITSPVPMKDEMGMDYVPVYADEAGGAATAAELGTVTIDPVVVQNMNIQVEPAERRNLVRRIRSVGYLEYDQERMVTVTTKYGGYIEKVYVNYIGEPVKKGQALFEVYSPELVQTEQELLSAMQFAKRLQGSDETRSRAEALVDAARTRLGYWDISPDQIEHLAETGQVFRTLTVTAPSAGLIMKRMEGLEGMAVRSGMEIFHIADLSSLWLSVELFEEQVSWVREGMAAKVTLSYFPGETFEGRVRFIEPEFSEQTRTLSVTLRIPNTGGRLRKGMFATVVFEPVAVQEALAVPTMAVLRTGQRNVVIVKAAQGRFSPREVVLGHEGEGFVEILQGLKEGELVITSAQFLLDSESRLQQVIQKMFTQRASEGEPGEVTNAEQAH